MGLRLGGSVNPGPYRGQIGGGVGRVILGFGGGFGGGFYGNGAGGSIAGKSHKPSRRHYSRRVFFLPNIPGSFYLRFVGQNLTRFFKINPSLILGTGTINNAIFNRSLRTNGGCSAKSERTGSPKLAH